MSQSIRSILPVFCFLFLAAAICHGQGKVSIKTIDGRELSGTLQQIDSNGTLIGDAFTGVNIAQVLSLTTENSIGASAAGPIQLGLVGGGRLKVADVLVDGETIQFKSSIAGLESLPLKVLRSIVFENSPAIEEAIAQPATDEDTVLVRTATSLASVSGLLESINAESLQLNFKGKSRPIKLAKVAAVVIADLELESPQGLMATVSLVDRSSVKGAFIGFDEQFVSLELSGQQQVRIDRKSLSRIDLVSDRIAYLASLEPVEVQQQAQFVVARPWQKNRSVAGNSIRLKTERKESQSGATQIETFASGIGTSSYSRIVFENTKDFDRLVATVGIDAETEGRGDCVMRVEGDGIALWSQRIRGDDNAVEIDVDISGIREVALIVDPGEQFDLADHADWAEARFLKTD